MEIRHKLEIWYEIGVFEQSGKYAKGAESS